MGQPPSSLQWAKLRTFFSSHFSDYSNHWSYENTAPESFRIVQLSVINVCEQLL